MYEARKKAKEEVTSEKVEAFKEEGGGDEGRPS
jgi:hypothetical protein